MGRGVFLGVSHAPHPSAPQFLEFPSIYAYTVWHRTRPTKFDVVTHMERWFVFRGHPSLHPKGRGPSTPQFWGFPFYLCTHPLMHNYQISFGNTYGEGLFLGGQPREGGLVFRWSSTLPPQMSGVPALPTFVGSFLFMRKPTPYAAELPDLTW